MSKRAKKLLKQNEVIVTDELNPRWAKFTELYILNGNAYQSAVEAGFSEEYAKVITSRFPDKVIKSLKDALEHKGITTDKIADKIKWLLDHDSYKAVANGIEFASKIRGDYSDGDKAPKVNNTYNFIFNAETQADIKTIEEKIKQRLINGNVQTPEKPI